MKFVLIFTFLLFLFYKINIILSGRISSIRNETDLGITKHIKTTSSQNFTSLNDDKNFNDKNKEYIQIIEIIEENSDSFEYGSGFHDIKDVSKIKKDKILSKLNRDECVLVCKEKNDDNRKLIFSEYANINPNKLSKNIFKKAVSKKSLSYKTLDSKKEKKIKTKADIEVENVLKSLKKLNVTVITDENKNEKISETNCNQPANIAICKVLAYHGADSKISDNSLMLNCCCDFASKQPEKEFCQNYQKCVSNRKCLKESEIKDARESFEKSRATFN